MENELPESGYPSSTADDTETIQISPLTDYYSFVSASYHPTPAEQNKIKLVCNLNHERNPNYEKAYNGTVVANESHFNHPIGRSI